MRILFPPGDAYKTKGAHYGTDYESNGIRTVFQDERKDERKKAGKKEEPVKRKYREEKIDSLLCLKPVLLNICY